MTKIFSAVLDMSLTASIVICFVFVARLALRRAPKIFSYALWAVVLFRLLCPVSFSVPMAPLELVRPQVIASGEYTSTVSYIPAQPVRGEQTAMSGTMPDALKEEASAAISAMDIGAILWLCGIGILVLYSAVMYLRLRRDLVGAVLLGGNVYLADHISSPFVLGILRPKIYLPSSIPIRERSFILAHERHHIRRGDHLLKLLAWLALCIHWFDPLVWAAFILAGKDMEMSCDEAVIRELGPSIRADYSQSLLRLATGQRIIAFAPLAFGEGDTKGRVLNMAKWKKPKLWISVLCVIVSAAVLAACAVNPENEPEPQGQGAVMFGHLSLGMPQDYTHGESGQGGVSFYDGETLVGGIERYPVPQGVDPYALDSHDLGVVIGVADAQQENLAYFGSSSAWADLEIEYFDELEPENLNRSHYYYIYDLNVYDVWFDNNQMSQDSQILFLSAIQRAPGEAAEDVTDQVYDTTEPAPGTEEERTKEELEREVERLRQHIEDTEALKKCRGVLELVQGSGSWWILNEKTNEGGSVINSSSTTDYLSVGEDLLCRTQIPESGIVDGIPVWFSMFAYMKVDGVFYSNEANAALDEEMRVQWSESSEKEVWTPWLATYKWNEAEVEFVSVTPDGAGECIQLQINTPYNGREDSYPSYTVSFWFDGSGAFRYAEIRGALKDDGTEGDYHFLDRESIVTLNEAQISQEIEREHQRAIGS